MADISRRNLLKGAAAVAGVGLWPGRGRGQVPPSERITTAVIGLGAMGNGHLGWALGNRSVQLLAVCEVDQTRRDAGVERARKTYADRAEASGWRGVEGYNDFRELLARDDLDTVVIATPDHWHTPLSIYAARAGKDVYCEKPVTLTLAEGRQLVETMDATGCIFQTGTQYRSMATLRRVVQFVRDGGLGRIERAFTLWTRIENGFAPVSYALPAEPVPAGLDWDLWVGPAAFRPYNSRLHRNPIPGVVPWGFCEDYGAGAITYHHSHAADVSGYALGLERTGPVEIIHPKDGQFPTTTLRYANGTLMHLVESWAQMKKLYHAVPDNARIAGNFGGVFVGERGWVTALYGSGRLEGEPASIFEEMGLPRGEIGFGNDHHANWLEGVRTRQQPRTPAELGHRAAAMGHLAHLSFNLNRSLRYDPATETFPDDAEANRLRARARRQPWVL